MKRYIIQWTNYASNKSGQSLRGFDSKAEICNLARELNLKYPQKSHIVVDTQQFTIIKPVGKR